MDEVLPRRQKLLHNLEKHLVDGTAMVAESTPPYAFYEIFVTRMSTEVSVNARAFAATLAYTVGGYLYTKGRDKWRQLFHITDETIEKIQNKHDALYCGAFNLTLAPIFYLAAGETSAPKIAAGALCSAGLGLVNGIPMGYAIDTFRDLTGIQESSRVPSLVKRQHPHVKKGLAALLVVGALALTAAVYEVGERVVPQSQTQYSTTKQP